MVSLLIAKEVHHGFEPQSGQTKDYEIGICYFSLKQATLRSKSKNMLAKIWKNMSAWNVYSWTVVSVGQHYKNPTKHVGLVQSRHHLIEM